MIGSGGIGSYISELIPHILSRHNCLLIGTHAQCMEFVREPNAEFCFCDTRPFSLEELRGLPRSVEERIRQYDVYFTPYCNVPGRLGIPVACAIHDVVFLDVPGLAGPFGRLVRRWFYRRAVEKSGLVVTVSEFSKSRIEETLRCRKRIVVTPNGVPAYLTRAGGDEDVKPGDYILFVGNIKRHKGLPTLLDAFEKAAGAGFTGRLVIVGNAENFRTGDGAAAARIRALSDSGATAGRIEFTGRVPQDKLRALYRGARLLVQPSLYEGFGIPPLEAMASGTPALVSDIPVFREVYGSLPVRFFEPGNAEDLAGKLLAGGWERLPGEQVAAAREAYSYRRSAEILCDALKELAGAEGGE